jgi:hypothetical protein
VPVHIIVQIQIAATNVLLYFFIHFFSTILNAHWKFIKIRGYCFRAFMKEMHLSRYVIKIKNIIERGKYLTGHVNGLAQALQ